MNTYRAGSILTSPRTDLAMTNSGNWVKVGRKHYRHKTGHEITYDFNHHCWCVSINTNSVINIMFTTLDAARHHAERLAK